MFEVVRTEAFALWLQQLADRADAVSINARIARLSLGNFGDHKPISDGFSELRIDMGPGYRVYYPHRGKTRVMLLIGGAKGTQKRGIKRAIEMMQQLEE